MPQTHPTVSTTGLVPVPVAVLLPTPGEQRTDSAFSDLPDWHGVTARDAAGLITRLTAVGDLVIELDGHPTITRAAEHLGRRCPVALAGGHGLRAPATAGAESARGTRRAGLIFAALPRPDVVPDDLVGLSEAMQTWRAMLRPGGYLLTALTTPGPDLGILEHPATYRGVAIAAARTAGFAWQQEFLVLTAPPPEDEPRAMAGTPADLPTALLDGRHRRVHVKVLAFRDNSGGGNV